MLLLLITTNIFMLGCFKLTEGSDFTRKAMLNYKIEPEVIQRAPSTMLPISFDGKKAILGQVMKTSETKNQPEVLIRACYCDFNTLLFVDPDAPSRKNTSLAQVLHWMVVNIPGGNVSQGETIAEYISPGPFPGTGYHRYSIFSFKQYGKQVFNNEKISADPNDVTKRFHFNVNKFAKDNNLGDAVAGNFFQARYED